MTANITNSQDDKPITSTSGAFASLIIDSICNVAGRFAAIADELYPQLITRETIDLIQGRISQNVDLLMRQ